MKPPVKFLMLQQIMLKVMLIFITQKLPGHAGQRIKNLRYRGLRKEKLVELLDNNM